MNPLHQPQTYRHMSYIYWQMYPSYKKEWGNIVCFDDEAINLQQKQIYLIVQTYNVSVLNFSLFVKTFNSSVDLMLLIFEFTNSFIKYVEWINLVLLLSLNVYPSGQ